MTDLVVGTKDLRQALQAVVAHASTDSEELTFTRIRLVVDPVNVQVYATQGFTAGLAIVSVIDNVDGEAGHWDMPPSAVKDLLTLFPVGKDVEEDATLRFTVDAEHVTVQDVSGLFPGKSVTLPRLPDHSYYPDMPGVIGAVRAQASGMSAAFVTTGPWWATFVAATKAYREPLLVTPSNSGGRSRMVITVGDSFIGLLTASSNEDHINGAETARDDWAARLPTRPRWERTDNDTPDGESDVDDDSDDEEQD